MRRRTILPWSLALAVVIGSGLAALAGNQPACCVGNSAGGTVKVTHNGAIWSAWQQALQCLPSCGQPVPCSFCMTATLYVWNNGGWTYAPPGSTGVGPFNATGYEIQCGQTQNESWSQNWGSYGAGNWKMTFALLRCAEPCSDCELVLWTGDVQFFTTH
jgi:hypothetical protein